MKGWIYILKRARENTLKIGKTSRTPEERAEELSATTGVSTPFVVVHSREVKNMDECEKKVHKKLSKYRYRKEFFDIDVKTAIEVVDEVCDLSSLFITLEQYEKMNWGQLLEYEGVYIRHIYKSDQHLAREYLRIFHTGSQSFDQPIVEESLNEIEKNKYLIGSLDDVPFKKKVTIMML